MSYSSSSKYSCLYLVPKSEYESMKSSLEGDQAAEEEEGGSGGIHQINNIEVTRGGNVIIRGDEERHLASPEDPRAFNLPLPANPDRRDDAGGAEEDGDTAKEGRKGDVEKKKVKKKPPGAAPRIGTRVSFPQVHEQTRVGSALPLELKRGEPPILPHHWNFPTTNAYPKRPRSYYTPSSAPSSSAHPSASLPESFPQARPSYPPTVSMRTAPSSSSARTVSSSSGNSGDSSRGSRSSRGKRPSVRQYHHQSRGRSISSLSSASAPKSSPPPPPPPQQQQEVVLPLPDNDEPMPLAASGLKRRRFRKKLPTNSELEEIVSRRLDILRGKKRTGNSASVASEDEERKRGRKKYTFAPLETKRKNPFVVASARKKRKHLHWNEEGYDG